ncbi:hypothetical protein FQA47_020220 [Oryzias melastigma]|uniref:Uncharacterized protein n=1 Tax=Oryzias melastigma TaxID=30732 RepID=A0A834BZK4_ORYME|nr:hypothetical protein FQA47_020220 [Oryzias melastigma]
MDDIQVVESKPLLVDRELPGLREAVQQLVVKKGPFLSPAECAVIAFLATSALTPET